MSALEKHACIDIKASLEEILEKTQKSMEAGLRKISLAEVVSDMKRK